MRERTPSADDTPKRAPPAPVREAASVDITGNSETTNDTAEDCCAAKLSISLASTSMSFDGMVASNHTVDDLAANDRQQHQQQQLQDKYGHAYKSAQTAQDKRSRLSNVINNLRKKVPDGSSRNADSPGNEENDRGSVERNLETLEKYVMTVLNGVIKDDEDEDKEQVVTKGKNLEKTMETEWRRKTEDDPIDTAIKSELLRSNESDTEAAVVPRFNDSAVTRPGEIENVAFSEITDSSNVTGTIEENSVEDMKARITQDTTLESGRIEEIDIEIKKSSIPDFSEDNFPGISKEKKEARTLGTIIMERLCDHQVEERANVDDGRGYRCESVVKENLELQTICKELLNDVLNDIHRMIEQEKPQTVKKEECEESKETDMTDSLQSRQIEKTAESAHVLVSMTSLHCSLPLDKVASVLQNCQAMSNESSIVSQISSSGSSNSLSIGSSPQERSTTQKSVSKQLSCATPVRHLCLYCDRKFLSVSLLQRHTERAHQHSGGRRSERNSRKPLQNCQYCSKRCADTLEGLFQHMVGSHADKYHACVQCLTRYLTKEVLTGHINEVHSGNVDRALQSEKVKEGSPGKEFSSQNIRDKIKISTVRERKSEESHGDGHSNDILKKSVTAREASQGNPSSPEFDSFFYSNVSCNIRENLLHHLDGKLQTTSNSTSAPTSMATESKLHHHQQQQQQQSQSSYYEHNVNQIQCPIDISLTAATPVYTKGYSTEELENSSEYARKPGKTRGSRPRRVSFEKYNFPRKYDGKEQWTCSIKDLSKFDISTQLSLRKKQQLIKEHLTISRLHQTPLMSACESTEVSLGNQQQTEPLLSVVGAAVVDSLDRNDGECGIDTTSALNVVCCDLGELLQNEHKSEIITKSSLDPTTSSTTEFSVEFGNFMKLWRQDQSSNDHANKQEVVYAELTGEWSRPRIYICGACNARYVTLKEMEDHKASSHPNVWCSHFEFSGDQRELYKHLYLPGRNVATEKARNAMLLEKVCTKCTKNCNSLAELHRHMLECGGDQAWLLGLFGNGKKKCKWRPFGSRSRRRRQRGMKRNIQNSQTQRVTIPKEKQPTGPRVRPSDHESIQKMLANLPAKRATRKVLQDNAMRSQGRLRSVQTRSRPRIMIGDSNPSAVRMSRNKAALRNKLLKNAKSIQRNRCRSDNISAVIESVVKYCHENGKMSDNGDSGGSDGNGNDNADARDRCKNTKEISEISLSTKASKVSDTNDKTIQLNVTKALTVLGKRGRMKRKRDIVANTRIRQRTINKLANFQHNMRSMKRRSSTMLETRVDTIGEEAEISSPKITPKNPKTTIIDKNGNNSDNKKTSITPGKSKSLTPSSIKKKAFVNPVASLNASIKAKSQLRTQDGKFARNPNKMTELLPKSSETKMNDEKHKVVETIEIKSKLRSIQKFKKTKVASTRRITRLSSDTDKMPILEPAMQIPSDEEYVAKPTSDLPILSPVTSTLSIQQQKISRSSAKCSAVVKEKENNNMQITDNDPHPISEKNLKNQKQMKGKKKEETTDTAEENEVLKLRDGRRSRGRKSLRVENNNDKDNKRETVTLKVETSNKKETKTKKEEMTRETRNVSKIKFEKDSNKLSDIPFEVKKLLGSTSKKDLLSTLELATNDSSSKGSLRRSMSRSRKTFQVNDKNSRELDCDLNNPKSTIKKEKTETITRKSCRHAEKKRDDSVKEDTIVDMEKNISDQMIEHVQQGKRDYRTATKAKGIAIDKRFDEQDKSDNRQAEISLLDTKSEPASEIESDSFRKVSGSSGKRRSRIKSTDLGPDDTKESIDITTKGENKNLVSSEKKEVEEKIEESIDKIDKSEIDNDSQVTNSLNSTLVKLSLSHLQLETSSSNSVDSGKENSMETCVNVHKLKTAKPKKTWGTRRGRTSRKRSLSNVIGILTEGMNIPVEMQQSVVLTVQTSLDNPDRITRNNTQQSTNAGNNVTDSTENEIVTTNAITINHDLQKNDQVTCPAESEEVNTLPSDVSSEAVTADSPANDIILDLSRRKPKGKGSFLEKIVSKIAKQKDALLEGEVGSLLDTAADELTSILDEVGPTLVENTENTQFDETSKCLSNNENEIVSGDTKSSATNEPEVPPTESNDIVVPECADNSLKIRENLEEHLMQNNEDQSKLKDSSANMENNDTLNKQTVNTTQLDEITSSKKEAIISTKISDNVELSMIDPSTEIHIQPITMQNISSKGSGRKNSNMKNRKKSAKVSLRKVSNASKKNKKKFVESNKECTAEDTSQQKELHLDDVIEFTHKLEDKSDVRNEQPNANDVTFETSNAKVEIEKIQNQNNSIKDDSERLNLQKDVAENYDRSNNEKSIDPEISSEDTKELTKNLEDSIEKIYSKNIVTDTCPKELIESPLDSLVSEKIVEKKKSKDKPRKKNQVDKRKRKLQTTSLLDALPSNVATNIIPQTSVKAIDTETASSTTSFIKETTSLNGEQSSNVGSINENSDISLEISSSLTRTISNEHEKTQSLDNLTPSKKPKKKHDRRKKSLADEHLELSDNKPIDTIPKLNEESTNVGLNEQLSITSEPFKVPEVTELLQNTKKRGPKKKSMHEDARWKDGNVSEESRVNNEKSTEIGETFDTPIERTDERENAQKNSLKESSNTRKSNSLSSINSTSSTRTRSTSKKKQLSNEDLIRDSVHSAESTDDLSESSCVSESSYFRKKRFAKRKKKEEEISGNTTETDFSVVNRKSPRSDKRNSNNKSNKTKSLCDEHLDLSEMDDDIDIPMDIRASLENTEALENIEREFNNLTEKSSDSKDKCINKDEAMADKPVNDNSAEQQSITDNYDYSEDLVTPKKRAAGNFVVMHRKTGEILIVEKRKKLTKEAARFFCDMCATSFTRKSSLKKHTLSQSHLSQISKSTTRDKSESVNTCASETPEINSDETRDEQLDNRDQQTKDSPEHDIFNAISGDSLNEPNENSSCYITGSIESTSSLMSLRITRQQALEDELLDQEICKITENMSHDEYVLTDHMTPSQPSSTSTPIKQPQKKEKNSICIRGKRRNRSRKKNLAEEHLALDSPELKIAALQHDELSKNNDTIQISSPSCNRNSMSKIIETGEIVKEIRKDDILPEKSEKAMTDKIGYVIRSSDDETDNAKLLTCEIDSKIEEHRIESVRTTRSKLKKLSKRDNEIRESLEDQTISSFDDEKSTNRFGLRPRRNKTIIQHFDESDFDAEIDFVDIPMQSDRDETDDNAQIKQNKTEKETSNSTLPEKGGFFTEEQAGIESIVSANTEIASKSESVPIVDIRKSGRKRGRPRLKNRNTSNSNVESNLTSEFKVEENNATDHSIESKLTDQKSRLDIKDQTEKTNRINKSEHLDINIQSHKPKRGRPGKNIMRSANNSSAQTTDDCSITETTNCNQMKENAMSEEYSKMSDKIVTSNDLIDSVVPRGEFNLLEVKRSEINTENDEKICDNQLNISNKRSIQEHELTKITATINNTECLPAKNKSGYNDTTTVDKTQRDVLQVSVAIESDNIENSENQRLLNIPELSEQKQYAKSEDSSSEEEVHESSQAESKEDIENETAIADDKLLSTVNFRECISHKIMDDCNQNEASDELNSSKKTLKSSQSMSREREAGCKRSKSTRNRSKRVATSKVAELSSDSENEDKTESASSTKSKIVKSVFGRVFGDKAEKVKEVLNDWVSKSEDESDLSRSTSESARFQETKSSLRESTKINDHEHKKDKKHHSVCETKKDGERSSRKKEMNEKNANTDIHGKSKNRKKRERDTDLTQKDYIESLSPVNAIRRSRRESKIRADEKILRTLDEEESHVFSDYDENMEEVKESYELADQFKNGYSNSKDEESKYHATKDGNSTSDNWENLSVDHGVHRQSRIISDCHEKQEVDTTNEHSSSPSQFNMFKYRRRESKIRAGEKIWRAFDNETPLCLSSDRDLNETAETPKEQEPIFYECSDIDPSNNSKSTKRKNSDSWKNNRLEEQNNISVSSRRGRPRKDSSNRKKKDSSTVNSEPPSLVNVSVDKCRNSKTRTNERIYRNFDNKSLVSPKNEKANIEMHEERSTGKSRSRSKNLVFTHERAHESFVYDDTLDTKHKNQDNTISELDERICSELRNNQKGNENWKHSVENIDLNQENVTEANQQSRSAMRKSVETTLSSRNLETESLTIKQQSSQLDQDSQVIRESDADEEEEEKEEQEDDNDGDNENRRMSPFYAHQTDSSIENSSNNEDEEEGDEMEDIYIDNTKKANSSEFSGEKIIIRSPSLGHKSDVVTIAPTDAMEDNALDVPREITSTMEPRQGKILNFDEELFVECCSRLKATTENELRGAKKIKLDHTESYHRREDQPQGFRVNRDRWKDVESQNSLGSLLESVNQLLGEEMYSSREWGYRMHDSERSSRSASPDVSRADNLGYEDSLDVAFEHNNKLRDKIQQRMRESENLIASSFGQRTNDDEQNRHSVSDKQQQNSLGNTYTSTIHEQEHLSAISMSNREQDSSLGLKSKMNSTLGGLLDKALSNLLHSNGKHDHNGSAPMKLLAELACARAPTTTSSEETTNSRNHQSVKIVAAAVAAAAAAAVAAAKEDSAVNSPKRSTKELAISPKHSSQVRKAKNSIKELFERKKEINDRKEQQERSKTAFIDLNTQKQQRKLKRNKKQQQHNFPLIRRNEHYGLVEKKKRRDIERKTESLSEKIKDVYEFDEEESQTVPSTVMSYRSQADKGYETNWPVKKNVDDVKNDKTSHTTTKLNVLLDRKFRDLEKFAPKTKGALKSFQSEEQQRVAESITGPMDEFVQRKQQRLKRLTERNLQHHKLKKRGKMSKKRTRNAWYEDDSSDEFRTAAKAEDIGVGVGISKSQRACSKGKQNLFAELSTSSESELERDNAGYEIVGEQHLSKSKINLREFNVNDDDAVDGQPVIELAKFTDKNQIVDDWKDTATKQDNAIKEDCEVEKSESEMSDHSLIIDERKTTDDIRNSDDDGDNRYEIAFELDDDLYREDSSDTETEADENEITMPMIEETRSGNGKKVFDKEAISQTKSTSIETKNKNYTRENELIPLEEALDFLDHNDNPKSESTHTDVQTENVKHIDDVKTIDDMSNDEIDDEITRNKRFSPINICEEKDEPDDDLPALPEKLSTNEKPQKESENLPLHVFLSRKVQESKKRKQQQLDKLREEQERILMDLQPTRRQRKCAIGKQGLLAEISSSDEEPSYTRDPSRRASDKSDHDKSRKKKESKEKRKERYIEKKHEQIIAKEQKAIEEEILREINKKKETLTHAADNVESMVNNTMETTINPAQVQKKKHQTKEKQIKINVENTEKNVERDTQCLDNRIDNSKSERDFSTIEDRNRIHSLLKRKNHSRSPAKSKKTPKLENGKITSNKKNKDSTADRSKNRTTTGNKDSKERGKHDSDDEELKTTKSWNKVEEGVGVAIGRRKRTAALQLYYWSSSSDEEEMLEPVPPPEEEEDDRQEQHGWIVGDSHKRMITMLAMEKQLKEKRRRNEDDFETGKTKSKKHRSNTS